MSGASNTKAAYEECIGLTVKGVIYWARPEGRQARTLIFEDGTGLTCLSSGSYWREKAETVDRLIADRRRELEVATHDLEGVLSAAGGGS